jgi:hypothetical protein
MQLVTLGELEWSKEVWFGLNSRAFEENVLVIYLLCKMREEKSIAEAVTGDRPEKGCDGYLDKNLHPRFPL